MLKNKIKDIIGLTGYTISKKIKPINASTDIEGADFKKLAKDHSNHNPLKLHFGCGPRILKNWVNIDLEYCHYQDYLKTYTDKFYPEKIRGTKDDLYEIDVTNSPLPLPDNSVDLIFHEDFMEHINQKNQILFLSETYRILKKGSIHRISTPNLLTIMQKKSDFKKGFKGVYIFEWNKWRHKNILTPRILKEMALMVGYSDVIFNTRDKSISDQTPLEYRPAPLNEPVDDNEQIFADLIK